MTGDPPAPTPPALAQRLVRCATADPRWRDIMLGDLGEEFAAVAERRGAWRARAWYWQQALTIATTAAVRWIALRIPRPGDRPMRTALHDLQRAFRAMRQRPFVTAIIVLTLALALGVNAATFGMIDALLLRPFTIPGVDRLVVMSEISPTSPYVSESVSAGCFLDARAQTRALDEVAAYAWWDVNLAGTDRPERVQGFTITADFFQTVGASASLGRLLDADDMVVGRPHRAVISDSLWRGRFAAAPDIIGRTVRLDGESYTVAGVARAGFDFPDGAQVWAPLTFSDDDRTNYAVRYLTVIGRRAPGVSREQASSELSDIYTRLATMNPDATRHHTLVVQPFAQGLVDEGTPQALGLWQTAAALILLIGCANITSLLLARGAERRRELAVRLAIGAGRARLVRQLLGESLLLAAISVPAAIGVAALTFRAVRAALPATLVRFVAGWNQMGVDGRVLLFTAVAAVATVLLFGLLPALQSSRLSLTSALRDGGRTGSHGPGRSRLRRALVAAEIALSLPLLVVSGLSAIAAHRFASGPQGYDPSGVYRMRVVLPNAMYKDAAAQRQFVTRWLAEAERAPGVDDVATTSVAPSMSTNQSRVLAIEGHPGDPGVDQVVNYRSISTRYLQTMRIPLLQGRDLQPGDREDGRPVAVVSASMAARYWPGESPLDRRIRIGRNATIWTTVVGVVGDTVDDWFDNRRVPTVYVPVVQAPDASVTLVARTNGDPATLAAGLRAALAKADPDQASFGDMTMADAIRERTTGLRFISSLMTAFGLLALLLSGFGIYAVMAHHVQQRQHEIGIRMALGAAPRAVLWRALGSSLRLAAIGAGVGLVAAVALGRVMEHALFGVVAAEPALFAGVTAALMAVALVAGLVPAQRATRVDPIVALRGE